MSLSFLPRGSQSEASYSAWEGVVSEGSGPIMRTLLCLSAGSQLSVERSVPGSPTATGRVWVGIDLGQGTLVSGMNYSPSP